MTNLKIYIDLEDASRRDSSEGQGHFQRRGMVTIVDFGHQSDETSVAQAPGYVQTHVELSNPKFVLGCSRPGVALAYLKQRFGPWVVRIDEPRRFAQEVSDYLGTLPHKFAGGIEGCVVHYNKGGKVGPRLTNIASTRLSYAQKPIAFSDEKEFRFVAISMGTPGTRFDDDYLPLDLDRRLDYVAIM